MIRQRNSFTKRPEMIVILSGSEIKTVSNTVEEKEYFESLKKHLKKNGKSAAFDTSVFPEAIKERELWKNTGGLLGKEERIIKVLEHYNQVLPLARAMILKTD